MEQVHFTAPPRRWAETLRPDAWLTQPLGVFFALSAFLVYATWASFQGEYYHFGPYLSPLYSPELFGDSPHRLLGPAPGWWPEAPDWWPESIAFYSPAFLVLAAAGGFRFTCYYYRGAYYKAFWHDPPACGVGEPRTSYRGENSFPLIMQNLHRYFLVFAVLLLVFLTHDVWNALWFEDEATGTTSFGVGVGTLVLALNVVLLGSYTLSCHSLRHLVGGRCDRLAGRPIRRPVYDCVSCLNRRHMLYAWMSLVWVGFSDVYVRLCAMGVLSDVRLL